MSLAHVQVHGRFRACFWWRGWSIRWQGIGGLGVSADIHGFWIQEGAKDLDKWNRRIKSHESQTWFITYVIPAIRYPVSATDTVYQPKIMPKDGVRLYLVVIGGEAKNV